VSQVCHGVQGRDCCGRACSRALFLQGRFYTTPGGQPARDRRSLARLRHSSSILLILLSPGSAPLTMEGPDGERFVLGMLVTRHIYTLAHTEVSAVGFEALFCLCRRDRSSTGMPRNRLEYDNNRLRINTSAGGTRHCATMQSLCMRYL